jgi:hypothetical protein
MGLFGWLRPEEEPEDGAVVEISDDRGTHIVISTPTHGDALDVEGWVRLGTRAKSDRDESLSQERRAAMQYQVRDHDELRVRSARVVNPKEDLEDSHDREGDYSDDEPSEQAPVTGGELGRWWPWGLKQ